MDMISITVVILAVITCVSCTVAAYKVVKYRDSHLEEWTSQSS